MDASIKILIEAVDKASPELQKLQDNLNKTEKSIVQFAGQMGKLSGAVIAAAVTGIAALTKQAINAADEMGKTAQKIGISTESLSALAYAAKLSDVGMDQLKTGFNQLNKSIVEANKPTSAAAAAFKYLGVEVKNADGSYRKADEVFKDIATSMAKLPDGTSKSAVAMEIFGKAGADLIPLLNSGAAGLEELRVEAEKLGIIMSSETTKNAENFNDSLTRLSTSASGVGLSIAKEVLPTLNALSAQLVDTVKNGEGFKDFAKGVGEVFKFTVKVIATAISTVNAFGKGIGAVMAAVATAATGDFAGAGKILSEWKSDVDDIDAANQKFIAGIEAGIPSIEKTATATGNASSATKEYTGATKDSTAAKDAEAKAFDKAYAAMVKSLDSTNDLTAAQQVELNIAKKVAGFRTTAHQERMRQIAAEVDAKRMANITASNAINVEVAGLEQLRRANEEAGLAAKQFAVTRKQGTIAALDEVTARRTLLDITQELREAETRLAVLNKDPERNAKAIQDVQALITGLKQYQTSTDSGTVVDDIIKAGKEARDTFRDMVTYQTYIGGAKDKLVELNRALAVVQVYGTEAGDGIDKIRVATEKINEEKFALLRANVTALQKKVADVAATIQSTLGDAFYNIMQGNFKNIGEMFKQMLDRMVADALAANLAKMIFGDFTNTGSVSGTGGGLLTSIMGANYSGILGSMFKADGGPVTAGQAYIVGERRPELFIPQTNGTIMPDTSAINGGGGNQINFSITAMDSQDVIRAMDKIKRPLTEMINGTNKSYNMR